MSGTSMATPTCAGASALVRQYFREGFLASGARNVSAGIAPSASLVKAIMVHAGQPMWFQESSVWTLPPSLPHFSQGFGRVDLNSVLYFGAQTPFKLRVLDREVVQDQQTRHYCFLAASQSSYTRFRASLVWTDPPAPAWSQRTLIHDLNLMVQDPSRRLYFGNNLTDGGNAIKDSANNCEQVTIANATGGIYRVMVEGPAPTAAPPTARASWASAPASSVTRETTAASPLLPSSARPSASRSPTTLPAPTPARRFLLLLSARPPSSSSSCPTRASAARAS
eukprot:750879-Hanusia_phi.AAC.1